MINGEVSFRNSHAPEQVETWAVSCVSEHVFSER